MDELLLPIWKTPRWKWRLRRSKHIIWTRLCNNVRFVVLAGLAALIMWRSWRDTESSTGLFYRTASSEVQLRELQLRWNYGSHKFQPRIRDWGQHRATWMNERPKLGLRQGEGRPKYVLMVTSSPPESREPSIISHMLLRAGKNKLDYCRLHDIDLYYDMGEYELEFTGVWAKLPIIRRLMLHHPEVEWIWWLDADAVFINMAFEHPFADFHQHNLLISGSYEAVYDFRNWTGLSTSNFLIRNCQWSLNLLDAWASMGTLSVREEAGKFQSFLLADRPFDLPGDDQSGLIAMLVQDNQLTSRKQRWAPMVKMMEEKDLEYSMKEAGTVFDSKQEVLTLQMHDRTPLVSHFSDCLLLCTAPKTANESAIDRSSDCIQQMEFAFDFADNQVYERYGFQPRRLGSSTQPLIAKPSNDNHEATYPAGDTTVKEFRLPPKYMDWDERRLAWMQKDPPTNSTSSQVLLVSGSSPEPCPAKLGSHLLLRGLKNLIDYGRSSGVKVFYNNAVIDKQLTGWWSKIPLLKMLMVNNPSTEWIWWIDSDAAFTNMDFQIPIERYNAGGYNLVMYGSEHETFVKKTYTGINTGNFLIRNCQWSMDLFDRWASFGATLEIQAKSGQLFDTFFTNRPLGWYADDQSALAYLLIAEKEKWVSQTYLENIIVMSGNWKYWTPEFDRRQMNLEDRPFVTHFAGCKPCKEMTEECLIGIDKAYNFADNQVLEKYGLRHENLLSSKLEIHSDAAANL